jgi:hypothetical protein
MIKITVYFLDGSKSKWNESDIVLDSLFHLK